MSKRDQTMTADPVTIGKNAQRVADQHDDHEHAIAVEDNAYLDLLESVLRAAEPARDALGSALPDDGSGGRRSGLLLVRGEDEEIWWLDPTSAADAAHDAGGLWRRFRTPSGWKGEPCLADAVVNYGRHGVVEAIMQISIALDAQLRGGKQKATEKIRRRAEQIRALSTLVRALA